MRRNNCGLTFVLQAAAKEDIAAKAVLKDIRSSTAALASVTPMEALNKVFLMHVEYLKIYF